MRVFRHWLFLVLVAITAVSFAGTFGRWWVDEAEAEEHLSIRQESASGGFFNVYRTRVHLGGGLGGGK